MKIIRNPDGDIISVILPGEHSRETVLQSLTETESVWKETGGETIPIGHWVHEIVPLVSFAPPAGHDEAMLVRHDSGLLYTILRDEQFMPYADGSADACELWSALSDLNPPEELLALRTADAIGWTPFHSDDELVGIIKAGTFSRADCEYAVQEVFGDSYDDENGVVYTDWTTVVQYLKTFTLPAQQRPDFSRDEDVTEYFTHPDGTLHTVFSSSPKVYSQHAVQAVQNWRCWTNHQIPMDRCKGGEMTYRESLIADILQSVETAFWSSPAIVTCKRSESGEWAVNVAVPDRTIEVDDEYPSDSEVRDYAEGMINGMEVSLFNVIDAEYMLKRLADWFEMSAEPETNQNDIFEEEQT